MWLVRLYYWTAKNCVAGTTINPWEHLPTSSIYFRGLLIMENTTNFTLHSSAVVNEGGPTMHALFGVVAGLSLIGNLLLCIVMLRRRTMLTKTYNILIFNLAIADMLTGWSFCLNICRVNRRANSISWRIYLTWKLRFFFHIFFQKYDSKFFGNAKTIWSSTFSTVRYRLLRQ